MQTSVYIIFLLAVTVLGVALILLSPKKKKPVYVIDENHAAAANQYNTYLDRVRRINDSFAETLSAKQRLVLLNQDAYAHQKCAYLVDEWNETSEIIQSRLNSVRNHIDTGYYAQVPSQLADLDKDIEYMNGLLQTLKGVEIETVKIKMSLPEDKVVSSGSSSVSYFDDCKTREDLITRYKALAKVFHPDSKAGNEAIFREIKEQFDSKLQLIPRK